MFPNPQDALPLPARPNLEQYKKLAKSLLKACKLQSSNPESIEDWAERWVNQLVKASALELKEQDSRPVRVNQWIVGVIDFVQRQMIPPTRSGRSARESSTGKAKQAEKKVCNLASAQFVIARSHGFCSWPQFVHHVESLARSSSREKDFEAAADAIVTGDLTTLKRLLRRNPQLARARSTREHNATLLHYVSANGVEGYRQRSPGNAVEVAQLLLDRGAEVDAEADVYGGGATALGLIATSVHPQNAGVQLELLDLLLRHGATIEHPRAGGNNSVAVMACLANGQPRAAEFLAERGARLDFIAAAGIGNLEHVRKFFRSDGTPTPNVPKQQMEAALRYASAYGRREAVKFLLEKGIDVAAHSGDGQTALHYAAMFGQLEIIKLLLARQAPLEIRNQYGGTVLGQTLWSAAHGGDPRIYVPIIETLIAAGAKLPERHVPVNAAIDALLESYGSRPEPEWHWFGEETRKRKQRRQ